ncbi:Nucleic acid-binding [Vigna unguiculata]|uniref:Nucleic acid-binding n=1 Tax=Vigna unguiculata TaxID=3917 RepID=A0A4D6KR98_VIGUN|nr:Nucleic acid-binding [Vigna unguiculata]
MFENNESPSQGLTQLSQTSKNIVEENFLTLTPRTTIQGLKDCKEVTTYILFGTIKHILVGDDWWYTACVCNKVVYPDSKMFFCEKCNKHVIKDLSVRFTKETIESGSQSPELIQDNPTNDDANSSHKRESGKKTASLESIEEDNVPLKLLKRNIKKEKAVN